jgi:hypothetical protein
VCACQDGASPGLVLIQPEKDFQLSFATSPSFYHKVCMICLLVNQTVLGFSWGSSTSVWTYRPNIERYLSAASDLSPRSSTPQRRCTELHSSVWTFDTSSTHSLANNAEHAQHAGAAGAGSGEVVVGLSGRERTRSASQSASRLLLLHRGTIYVLLASHGYANG